MNRNIIGLDIITSSKCNMNCEYCYIRRNYFYESEISEEVITHIPLFLKKIGIKKVSLHFFYGEPLIYWEKIKDIIKKLKENHIEIIRTHITTNGTLLSENILKEMKKMNVHLAISLDGNKDTFIYRGNESLWKKVYSNAKNALSILDKNITIFFTFGKKTLSKLFDGFMFLYNNGFKNIFLSMVDKDRYGLTSEEIKLYFEQQGKIFDFFLSELSRGENIKINIPSPLIYLLKKHVNQDSRFDKLEYLCGSGVYSYTISPKGEIYPCIRFYNLKETFSALSDSFDFGNIFSGINQTEIERWRNLLKVENVELEPHEEKIVKYYSKKYKFPKNFVVTLLKGCVLDNLEFFGDLYYVPPEWMEFIAYEIEFSKVLYKKIIKMGLVEKTLKLL